MGTYGLIAAYSFQGTSLSLPGIDQDVRNVLSHVNRAVGRAHESLHEIRRTGSRQNLGRRAAYGAAAETITVNDPVWSDAGIGTARARLPE